MSRVKFADMDVVAGKIINSAWNSYCNNNAMTLGLNIEEKDGLILNQSEPLQYCLFNKAILF